MSEKMNESMTFPCAINADAEAFCRRIVIEMIRRFSIPQKNAVARVNLHWQGQQIGGPEEIAYHEDEVFWAQDIYWGHNSYWWLTDGIRKEKNLPPLRPKEID